MGRYEIGRTRLALAFAVLLALVVGVRLALVWLWSSSGWVPFVVSLVIVAVFVGLPAAYGLLGLVRDDGDR